VAKIIFRSRFLRRVRDPFFVTTHAIERHVLFVAVSDLPAGVVLASGHKSPKPRWNVYKDVQASLLDKDCTPGTFHLKNRGITLIAKDVHTIEDDEYEVDFAQGHGLIDGNHTYRMIIEAQQNPNIELPKKQYVKVEILTSVPDEWVDEISSSLNTSIQASSEILPHLQDAIQWIKDELKDQPYYRSISWSENERGVYDVREILSILTCFNTTFYANKGSNHPVAAYDDLSVVLGSFAEEHKTNGGKAYKQLRPVLKDVLTLHDTIQIEFPKFLEQNGGGDSALIERAAKQPHEFSFLQTRSTERLARGALFPILAAFRWMIEDDPVTGQAKWRGGFDNVLERWRGAAERLVTQTVEKSGEVADNPDAIGRSASHWSALHKEVAFVDFMATQNTVPETVAENSQKPPDESPEHSQSGTTQTATNS